MQTHRQREYHFSNMQCIKHYIFWFMADDRYCIFGGHRVHTQRAYGYVWFQPPSDRTLQLRCIIVCLFFRWLSACNCGHVCVCASISFVFWSVQMTDFDLLSAIHIPHVLYYAMHLYESRVYSNIQTHTEKHILLLCWMLLILLFYI